MAAHRIAFLEGDFIVTTIFADGTQKESTFEEEIDALETFGDLQEVDGVALISLIFPDGNERVWERP